MANVEFLFATTSLRRLPMPGVEFVPRIGERVTFIDDDDPDRGNYHVIDVGTIVGEDSITVLVVLGD